MSDNENLNDPVDGSQAGDAEQPAVQPTPAMNESHGTADAGAHDATPQEQKPVPEEEQDEQLSEEELAERERQELAALMTVGKYHGKQNIEIGSAMESPEILKVEIPGLLPVALNTTAQETVQFRQVLEAIVQSEQAKRRKHVQDHQAQDLYVAVRGERGIILFKKEELEAYRALSENDGWSAILDFSQKHLMIDEDEYTNTPRMGNGDILGIGFKNFEDPRRNAKSNPIAHMRQSLGLSVEATVPLFESGMSWELVSTGTMDQLSLETRILMDKTNLGRESAGNIFGAASVYMNRHVMNFILDLVKKTTLGSTDPDVLKKVIKMSSFESLVVGAASILWPDGYKVERPCLVAGGGCGHVHARLINPRKMVMTRWKRLDDNQKAFMSRRSQISDIKTIEAYQAGLRPEVSRYVKINGEYELKLRVPNFYDYERLSTVWLDNLTNSVNGLVTSNATAEEREDLLDRAAFSSRLMAYASWFEALVRRSDDLDEPEIVISRERFKDDPEAYIKEEQEFERFLTDMSTNVEVADRIIEETEAFIRNMSLTVVGLVKMSCPNCNKPLQEAHEDVHPEIVPVNPVNLFFTLLRHKIRIASGR